MSSMELKFDDKKVDTQLAEDFLHKKSELRSSFADNGVIEYIWHNKVYLSDPEKPKLKIFLSDSKEYLLFYKLAQKVEENAELFVQLEYLLRGIPINHVKQFDIKLLVNKLIYNNTQGDTEKSGNDDILMKSSTPLAVLGCVNNKTRIVSTKETAAICSLFFDLCKEVGLNDVRLMFVSEKSVNEYTNEDCYHINDFEEFCTGCVGVVTEKTDVDSAVDSFLYATDKYPWSVKKIFVQECVLGRFKQSLEWKCQVAPGNIITRSCTSAYRYEDKLYLYEYAGNIDDIPENAISIEAYRTTKELLNLMSKHRPLCVSVWSSDVAEANQIAHGIDTNIIWINDFGHFDGPPISSESFYSVLEYHKNFKRNINSLADSSFVKAVKFWRQLPATERFVKMSKAFEKFDCNIMLCGNTTIEVGKKVCVVTKSPFIDFIYVESTKDVMATLNFILNGGGVIFQAPEAVKNEMAPLFENINAPVKFTNRPLLKVRQYYDTKAIWMNNGTTFAN